MKDRDLRLEVGSLRSKNSHQLLARRAVSRTIKSEKNDLEILAKGSVLVLAKGSVLVLAKGSVLVKQRGRSS